MKQAASSVSVDRPVHEVFDFLAEGRNNPLWRSDVFLAARIAGSGSELGVGATFMQKVVGDSGVSVEETYEITRYEPPHRLEFAAQRGSTRLSGRFTVVAINETTTHVEFTLVRVSPEFRSQVRQEYRSRLQRAVDSVEALPAAMKAVWPPPPPLTA